MLLTPEQIHDRYLGWLSGEIQVEKHDDVLEVTTPFLDSRNDHLQVYVVPNDDGFLVTDGGRTIRELEMAGVTLSTPKRTLLAEQILKSVSATRNDGRVSVHATEDNLGQSIQFVIKAMLALGDMYMLTQPTVEAVFWEDVQMMLRENEVTHESRVPFLGRSGYEHEVDFVIPASNGAPLRLLEAIDSPSKDKVNSFLWALIDTEYSRPERSQPYAFLNDRDGPVDETLHEALTSYSVTAVAWSDRRDVIDELRA